MESTGKECRGALGSLDAAWPSLGGFPWNLAPFSVYSGLGGPRSFESSPRAVHGEREIGLNPFLLSWSSTPSLCFPERENILAGSELQP